MVSKIKLLFICLFLSSAIYAQHDSLNNHVLKEVNVNDKEESDFGNLHKVDDMKVTVGKKSEVVHVDQLTVNKSTNNTRQIFAKVAGLNIFENDGSGLQLSIGGRGLDPNRTSNFNVRQNGYDISADALGYPESYYTPPADAIDRIEIIKGAAGLQFGTQFGGLLNFKLKQPGGEKPFNLLTKQTIGSWGFFGSFNSIYGTKGKLSYYAYAHYKRGNGWRPNGKYHALNAYVDIRYEVDKKNILSIGYTHLNYLAQQPGGLDDRMFTTDPRQSNRSRNWFAVKWDLLNIEWLSKLSERTTWQTQITGLLASRDAIGFRTNRQSQPDNGGPRDLLKGDFKNLTLESRLMHHYHLLGKRQTLLAGIRVYSSNSKSIQGDVNNGNDANFNFTNHNEVINDYTFHNLNFAAFAEHVFRITDKWSVTPGIRWEYINTKADGMYRFIERDQRDSILSDNTYYEQNKRPRNFIIAGLGSSYSFNQQLEAYGNISQNYRSVTFSDIQVRNPAFEIAKEISDEKGWSADLGLRGKVFGCLRFDINGFYLYYGNKIGEYYYAKSNGQAVRRRDNVGAAQIYGIENFLELDVARLINQASRYDLSIYSNLALTHATMTQSPIPNIKGSKVEYVPDLNWKTGVQARYKNLKLTFQLSHLSEQFTDATNAIDGGYSGVNGLLPAYTLLDISAGWNWKWLLVEASVNNLTNAVYATRRATGYPGPGIIPGEGRAFFLTFGVKL